MYVFCFSDAATTEIYTLSLHDALPICEAVVAIQQRIPRTPQIGTAALSELLWGPGPPNLAGFTTAIPTPEQRSEEHTSELQSRRDLVCRLLLEKKKNARSDDHSAGLVD